MASLQEQYDDAMYDFSTEALDLAIAKLQAILTVDPSYFDARLSLGMAYYRKGDYPAAILEGLAAEKLNPNEQLVHTNLSLFYLKAGDKAKAEHHGLQARIASWRGAGKTPSANTPDPELEMAKPAAPAKPPPEKFPDMPWKKKAPLPNASGTTHNKSNSQ